WALRDHVRAAGRAPGDGARRRPLFRAGRGMIGLSSYLVLAALVFSIGLFGVLTRRNAVGILLGIELMLNAVNINLVAFARFHGDLVGLIFTLFTISITVAEVAVGLAIVIAIFRVRRTVEADRLDLLRGERRALERRAPAPRPRDAVRVVRAAGDRGAAAPHRSRGRPGVDRRDHGLVRRGPGRARAGLRRRADVGMDPGRRRTHRHRRGPGRSAQQRHARPGHSGLAARPGVLARVPQRRAPGLARPLL